MIIDFQKNSYSQISKNEDEIKMAVGKVRLFQNCSLATLDKIRETARIGHLKIKQQLIADNMEDLYFLITGSAFAFHVNEDGKESVLNFFSPGDGMNLESVFSEIYCEEVLFECSRNETTVLIIRKSCLIAILQKDIVFSFCFAKYLSVSNEEQRNVGRLLRINSTSEKLLALLLQMQNRREHKNLFGYGHITHDNWASFAGVTRETVTREFKKMKQLGLIEMCEGSKTISRVLADPCRSPFLEKEKMPIPSIIPINTWQINTGFFFSGKHILEELRKSGCRPSGKWMLGTLSGKFSELKLRSQNVLLGCYSNESLGFDGVASLDDTFKRARALNLKVCHREHGLHFGLNYVDQPQGEIVHMAMNPVAGPGGERGIYRLGHNQKGRYLKCVEANPSSVWDAKHKFVFEIPTKSF